jgi:hypothetical protein
MGNSETEGSPLIGKPVEGRKLIELAYLIVILAVFALAKEFLLPLILAILISFLLAPAVSRLERWRFPGVIAILSVVGIASLDIGLFPVGAIYCDLDELERAHTDPGPLWIPGSVHEQRCGTFCLGRQHRNVTAGRYRLRPILDLALGSDRFVARDAADRLPGSVGSLFSRVPYLQCFASRQASVLRGNEIHLDG